MNYIHQLQNTVVEINDTLLKRSDRIQEMREHLASAKFGPQADGSRGDLIAVADVQRWLWYIEGINDTY
jgi:hypothetical protein